MKSYFIQLIPQVTVDNNLGPDRLAGPTALDLSLLQTTNPLIARPFLGSPNCAWYCCGQGNPTTHTINAAQLK